MNMKAYKHLIRLLEEKEAICAATMLSGENKGDKLLYEQGDKDKVLRTAVSDNSGPIEAWMPYIVDIASAEETSVINSGGESILVEIFMEKPRLVIFGGGHVGMVTAKLGKELDFHVTVVDDREEFTAKERFPTADELICADYHDIWDKIADTPNSYYVIATRGHLGDEVCAIEVLKRDCVYKGMIGSRGKVAATKKHFIESGVDKARIDELHAPIGLPLGGQTPMEIAVSIMAEIIQARYAHFYSVMDPDIWKEIGAPTVDKAVAATIIRKEGSSPRGVGSKMLVLPDGTIRGSIGGGSLEYAAICSAKEMIENNEQKIRIENYDLSNSKGAVLGMICGGKIRVILEPQMLIDGE